LWFKLSKERVSQNSGAEFARLVFASLLGGLVVSMAMLMASAQMAKQQAPRAEAVAETQTPALDHLETMTCPRGLRRVQQVLGQEDGFARTGTEPSRVDPRMTRFGLFRDFDARLVRSFGRRDYDEGGSDKALIDYFSAPSGIVSGHLVLRLKDGANGVANDFIQLIPSTTTNGKSGTERLAQYSISLVSPDVTLIGDARDGVVDIKLDAFKPQPLDPQENLPAYLRINTSLVLGNANSLNLLILDDTNVDVAALVLCLAPAEKQGVTLIEHSDKPLGPNVSVLQCSSDVTQSSCGPFSGDTACSAALPIACYKTGTAPIPTSIADSKMPAGSYVGGQVKLSQPTPADRFATRIAADAYCAEQFGQAWRVLRYGEGSGSMVISNSQISARTRAWVDITDQPLGRCWDRADPTKLAQ
jgi:hypothetical protein